MFGKDSDLTFFTFYESDQHPTKTIYARIFKHKCHILPIIKLLSFPSPFSKIGLHLIIDDISWE